MFVRGADGSAAGLRCRRAPSCSARTTIPTPGVGDVRGCIVAYHGLLNAERDRRARGGRRGGGHRHQSRQRHPLGRGQPGLGHCRSGRAAVPPRIPSVAVSHDDAAALEAAEGEICRVCTELEEGWFDRVLPVVEIPGTEEPERFVLLHGHYDSWSVGVGDNATGDAAMLEIARVLWRAPGGAAPLGAHRLVAGPLDGQVRRQHLVLRRVRPRADGGLRRASELRFARRARRRRLRQHSRRWRRRWTWCKRAVPT